MGTPRTCPPNRRPAVGVHPRRIGCDRHRIVGRDDILLVGRRRERPHRDVPVKIVVRRRLRQLGVARRALAATSLEVTICIDCSGLTHGPPQPAQPEETLMLTFIPRRSASLAACSIMSKNCGFIRCIGPGLTPTDRLDQHPVDPHLMHRLQVGGNARLRDVPV